MPNFIIKIFIAEFLTNFKVVELEHEFEPGDLGYAHRLAILHLKSLQDVSCILSSCREDVSTEGSNALIQDVSSRIQR